jgi:hypothetical protein
MLLTTSPYLTANQVQQFSRSFAFTVVAFLAHRRAISVECGIAEHDRATRHASRHGGQELTDGDYLAGIQ